MTEPDRLAVIGSKFITGSGVAPLQKF